MEKILKKALISCLFLYSFSVLGQTTEQEYLNLEANRIQKADSIEVDISNFIINNINNYILTPAIINEVTDDLLNVHDAAPPYNNSDIDATLLEVKRIELRKLYFQQNPSIDNYFLATTVPAELRITCINGGFENGVAGYNFRNTVINSQTHFMDGCAVNMNANSITTAFPTNAGAVALFTPVGLNQFQNSATLVSPGNEPFLEGLNIIINRVLTGNRSLKIGPNPNSLATLQIGNATSVSRNFIINGNSIDFSYLHFGYVVPANNHIQPFLRWRLYSLDNNGNITGILQEVCRTMNFNDCRYVQVADNRFLAPPNFGNTLSYTPNWICDRINTTGLNGQNVRLEFTVLDCQRRGHFNTVYIDDLCGVTCEPTFGSIQLNPININCPIAPFQVCGSFQVPSQINGITLSVLDQNGAVVAGPFNNPVINGQNFCFSLNPIVFGNNPIGNFTFQVNANSIDANCIAPLTDTLGTVSFNNCCLPDAILAAPNENVTNLSPFVFLPNPLAVRNLERSNSITASNIIGIGDNVIQNGVVYHAGNFVDLIPGFDAITGSQFAAYPQGCTNPQSFVYRQPNPNSDNSEIEEPLEINLVKIQKELIINPNPSNSFIDLMIKNDIFNKIIIVGIDGKIILDKTIESTTSFNLDISRYASGIYIVNVISNDGRQYSQKLIKN